MRLELNYQQLLQSTGMSVISNLQTLLKPARGAMLEQFAEDNACQFTANPQLPDSWKSLGLFNKRRRRQKHHLRRTHDHVAVHMLDFGYQFERGADRFWQTAVVFERFARSVPAFRLHPAHDFAPEQRGLDQTMQVSSEYLLTCRDEKMAEGIFDDQMMTHFQNNPGWSIDGEGAVTVFYKHRVLVEGDELTTFLATTSQLYKPLDQALFRYDQSLISSLDRDPSSDYDTIRICL